MRVIIIGAGVAGLSAGITLAKNGVEVLVVEKHSQAGGLCTGWSRKGGSGMTYSFNGCMHWLLGARKGTTFHKYLSELVDLSRIRFIDHRERVVFDYGDSKFSFLNKIDEFEKYLLGLAPEDSAVIKEWMSAVRFVNRMQPYLPPDFDQPTLWEKLKYFVKLHQLVMFVPFMLKWKGVTTYSFSERFKNESLRKYVHNLYSIEMQMMHVFFVQSYADLGVASYPEGGSEKFAELLAESYLRKGGKLLFNSPVKKIVVDNSVAKGVLLENGETLPADYVVSAADWIWTQSVALEGKYVTEKQKPYVNMPKEGIYYSYCMLYLGMKIPMSDYPHFIRISVPKIVSPDGTEYEQVEIHIYNYDRILTPEGYCTICVDFPTQNGAFWIDLRKRDYSKYKALKEKFSSVILDVLKCYFGESFGEGVDYADFVTPATYHRYTSNHNGSSQGWMPMKTVMQRPPINNKVKGLKCFFQAGHWTEAGGGLPIAIKSGMDCAKIILQKIR